MKNRLSYINLFLPLVSLIIGSCAANLNSTDDATSFAGFRSEGNIAPTIVDKTDDIWVPPLSDENYQPTGQYDSEEVDQSPAVQYNLLYHLYGPGYHDPYRSRIWSNHRRRHYDIPWSYGYDPFYDPYFQDPFWWGMDFRMTWGYSSWTDPYFDFMFYDPFLYANYYGYQYYGYRYDWHYWGQGGFYGTYYGHDFAANTTARATSRRSRGRGDFNPARQPGSASAGYSSGQSDSRVRSAGSTTGTNTSTSATTARVTTKPPQNRATSKRDRKSRESKSAARKKEERRRGEDN